MIYNVPIAHKQGGRRVMQRYPGVVFTLPIPCQILAIPCMSEKFPTNHLLKEQNIGVEDKLSPAADVWSYRSQNHWNWGSHGSSLAVNAENWQSRLTQAADEQPFKIKQINIMYGETEALNRKDNLGSEQNMENWSCSLYLCDNQTSPALCFVLRCPAHCPQQSCPPCAQCSSLWLTLPLSEQGWEPPELQRWHLQAATWACHLLQRSLPDGWADAAWNKETIIFAPGWVL